MHRVQTHAAASVSNARGEPWLLRDHSRFAKHRGRADFGPDSQQADDLSSRAGCPILRAFCEGWESTTSNRLSRRQPRNSSSRREPRPSGLGKAGSESGPSGPESSPHQQIVILRTGALGARERRKSSTGLARRRICFSRSPNPLGNGSPSFALRWRARSFGSRHSMTWSCTGAGDNGGGHGLRGWLRRGPGVGRVRGCFG